MITKFAQTSIGQLVAIDEAELKTGPFGTQLKASEYCEDGTPVINVRNIGFGTIKAEKLEFIGPITRDRLSSHLLRRGDIVFGRKGAVERHVFIRRSQEGWLQGSDCLRLRFKSARVESSFVSYFLLTPAHQRWMMNQCSHGATMASLNQQILERIVLPIPPLPIQRRVASILSAYDDLIENNLRRIRLLEQMAGALYREWFVEFRFPNHEQTRRISSPVGPIPEGWVAIPFERLLLSMAGGDWGSDHPGGNETVEVSIVRGTDFEEVTYGGSLRVPTRYISPRSLETRGLRAGDVIVENSVNAQSRSSGTTLLVDGEVLSRIGRAAVAASFCRVFRPHDSSVSPLVHLHMRYLRESARMEYYQNVAVNGIANFQARRFALEEHLVLPRDVATRMRLTNRVSVFSRAISQLSSQLSNLRLTRDVLLPRLLSGEIVFGEVGE
jgi:restriction endonuclease S subunit